MSYASSAEHLPPGDDLVWPDPGSLQALLVLGPTDTVLLFGSTVTRGRCWTDCAVIHRRDGAWTHLYGIEQPAGGGAATVHLRGFWQGEQLALARRRLRGVQLRLAETGDRAPILQDRRQTRKM